MIFSPSLHGERNMKPEALDLVDRLNFGENPDSFCRTLGQTRDHLSTQFRSIQITSCRKMAVGIFSDDQRSESVSPQDYPHLKKNLSMNGNEYHNRINRQKVND